jgi:hypothetical protein
LWAWVKRGTNNVVAFLMISVYQPFKKECLQIPKYKQAPNKL